MSHARFRPGRRQWLKLGSIAVVSVAVSRSGAALAQEKKGGKRVEESEQQAQALGYKHDATKVDKAKFPKFASGQTCANCSLYKAKATDAWGPCDIFGGREVNAKGWCSAWVKKA
jgi:High potential iron-sulfur protein